MKIAVTRPGLPSLHGISTPESAMADALVVAEFDDDMLETIRRVTLKETGSSLQLYRADLRFHVTMVEPWIIGVFVVEYKCKNANQAKNLLSMRLSTLQHHRRAIGLQDKLVYGASYARDRFQLFVSMWTQDRKEVLVFPIYNYSWNLTRPSELMQCFYYLRTLMDRVCAGLKDDFAVFTKSTLTTPESQLFRETWRFKPIPADAKIVDDSEIDDTVFEEEDPSLYHLLISALLESHLNGCSAEEVKMKMEAVRQWQEDIA